MVLRTHFFSIGFKSGLYGGKNSNVHPSGMYLDLAVGIMEKTTRVKYCIDTKIVTCENTQNANILINLVMIINDHSFQLS